MKNYNKEDVIISKKEAIKSLNKLLEYHINANDPTGKHLKKASILSKWISQYTNYISFEEKFSPKKLISYKRGDIIFANFGFNVGAEFGGEHYAVVIDKENARNSSTVTVIPLSSYKEEKELHPNDLYLGNELYEKLQLKFKTLLPKLREQCNEDIALLNFIMQNKSPELNSDQDSELRALTDKLEKRIETIQKEILKAENIQKELSALKEGSVAKIRQITTISKMRIYNPKNSSDPLYGIRFSEESMKLLNTKLKEFLIFND